MGALLAKAREALDEELQWSGTRSKEAECQIEGRACRTLLMDAFLRGKVLCFFSGEHGRLAGFDVIIRDRSRAKARDMNLYRKSETGLGFIFSQIVEMGRVGTEMPREHRTELGKGKNLET
jgi:hypothetical protein